jgi:hypothetical protein
MEHIMAQRVNVNFCAKLQESPSETLEMLKTVYGESPDQISHGCESPRSKQCWSAFSMSGISSTLNLYPKGPLWIRYSVWRYWKGLVRPWSTNKDSCGEIGHWFFTTTVCRYILHRVSEFIAGKGISTMYHMPYSPDLAPADLWLFAELKSVLKGKRFLDIEDINPFWLYIDI